MPTPDARPVGETALAPARKAVGDAFDQMVSTVIAQEHGDKREPDSGECIHDFYDALEKLEAAVAAEARAALLRDAPVVFVATDKSASVSELSDKPFEVSNGVAFADEDADVVTIWNHPPLTPPGTVRRAYLVIQEGEETPT